MRIDVNNGIIYQLEERHLESENAVKRDKEMSEHNEQQMTMAEHELEEELATTKKALDNLNKQNLQNHDRWVAKEKYDVGQEQCKEETKAYYDAESGKTR